MYHLVGANATSARNPRYPNLPYGVEPTAEQLEEARLATMNINKMIADRRAEERRQKEADKREAAERKIAREESRRKMLASVYSVFGFGKKSEDK